VQVHHEELSDVSRNINNLKHLRLEDKEPHFQTYIRAVTRYKNIDSSTKLLEIGTGTGWFPLICKKRGLNCKGLEISPQLIQYARQLGAEYGVEPDIVLGNIEETDIGRETYDVIIASNVFEHVEHWRPGIRKIYEALRPGGAMFFESTNKFSLTSGEYSGVPLYGWLPNATRYALRKKVHGEDIMKLGIDFHQFRYPLLRREFRRVGFSHIYDRVDMANPNYVSARWKIWIVNIAKRNPIARGLSLTFADVTRFLCIK
jgi:2-polyprenyl-3-methyl-5-hydroxy-6-metoxy-1,4-benzoquinol methylase